MTREISIQGRKIGFKYSPYVIAELSGNHNGSLERALKTIDEAHRCGASAIKLQTYTPDSMTIDCDKSDFIVKGGLWDGYKLYDLYKWAQTPYEWHKIIFEHARKIGITIFSTPFDEGAVDFLESLGAPAYKIASFENTDLALIEAVSKTRKPVIISTGMANYDEISESVETARSAGCVDLVLLHCISGYPTPVEQSNLLQINELAKHFNVISGLSDHTIGTTAAVAAVALGASIIEKHFILSRDDGGPDSAFSIEPEELSCLCRETRIAWQALGQIGYERQQVELGSRVFRRSIYFVRDLPKGSVINHGDIRRIRPGMGLAPKYYYEIIGKKLNAPVERGDPAKWDLFCE